MNTDRTSLSKVIKINATELTAGGLTQLFRSGAVAVLVEGDPRIRALWEKLIPGMEGAEGSPAECPPWNATIAEIARNHHARGGLDCVGDVMHFSPLRIAYVARKFELARDEGTGSLVCDPPSFTQQGSSFRPSQTPLNLCWEIGSDILAGFLGVVSGKPGHRVVLHRLKYEQSHEDIKKMCALIESTVGRWSQLGYKLDHYRELTRGPFGLPVVKDLFAMLCLWSPLRRVLMSLNERFDRAGKASLNGAEIIGKPHFDGRIFSALCGDRDTIRTEVFDGKNWLEIPLSSDSLVVLPGLSARGLGIRPTLHRVLHTGSDEKNGRNTPNITLLIGARAA